MTATLTDVSDLTAFEEDIAEPCSIPTCTTPAEYNLWLKHGPDTCPQANLYCCTPHKDDVIAIIKRAIDRNARACSKCKDLRAGGRLISEFVKIYPLK